ncbi:MAG TPA: caspase family protein [Mycobacterium sp.]|nr:caspase family protein [Mycobacterium sp.]
MAKRRSLHIGMNYVDPAKYGGWDGALSGCVNDANAMRDVAVSRGFEPQLLLNADATTEAVRAHLDAAAAELGDGDFFFLTYSGHGGQVPDEDSDEPDGLDETWCLYDSELVDDSLFGALCTFAAGVRVFVMSDSCHSETVTRQLVRQRDARRAQVHRAPGPNSKQAPLDVTEAEFTANKAAYDTQRTWWRPRSRPTDAKATVVLISGCRDDQTSMDGPVNGAFTGAFLQVWDNGNYRRGYSQLRNDVVTQISSPDQTPGLFTYGPGVQQMLPQIPLTDEAADEYRSPAAGGVVTRGG